MKIKLNAAIIINNGSLCSINNFPFDTIHDLVYVAQQQQKHNNQIFIYCELPFISVLQSIWGSKSKSEQVDFFIIKKWSFPKLSALLRGTFFLLNLNEKWTKKHKIKTITVNNFLIVGSLFLLLHAFHIAFVAISCLLVIAQHMHHFCSHQFISQLKNNERNAFASGEWEKKNSSIFKAV